MYNATVVALRVKRMNSDDDYVAALRFEALVPTYIDNSNPSDQLDKLQRSRVEAILEDEKGLTINRKI